MKTRIQLMLAIAAVSLLLLPRAGSAQNPMLDGLGRWSDNCGRCHNFRAAEERTDAEWAVIVSHMRARANLTKSVAEEILAFLQASAPQAAASADPDVPVAARPDVTRHHSPQSADTTPEALSEVEWAALRAAVITSVGLTP